MTRTPSRAIFIRSYLLVCQSPTLRRVVGETLLKQGFQFIKTAFWTDPAAQESMYHMACLLLKRHVSCMSWTHVTLLKRSERISEEIMCLRIGCWVRPCPDIAWLPASFKVYRALDFGAAQPRTIGSGLRRVGASCGYRNPRAAEDGAPHAGYVMKVNNVFLVAGAGVIRITEGQGAVGHLMAAAHVVEHLDWVPGQTVGVGNSQDTMQQGQRPYPGIAWD